MKKIINIIMLLMSTSWTFAQVGVNTPNPAATLDVVGKPTITSALDGLIPPRITGNQLRAKTYTTAQTGAIVYVTAADSAPAGQTVNVTSAGNYAFDGNVWVKFITNTLPTSQLVLLVRSSGSQLDTNAQSSGKLVYFADAPAYIDVNNDPGSWDTTNQRYTAPVAGVYQVVGTVFLSTCSGASDNAAAYIRTVRRSAGANYVINTADIRFTNGFVNTNQSTTIKLNAGDQIFFDYSVNGATYCSGSNSNIQRLAIYRFQ